MANSISLSNILSSRKPVVAAMAFACTMACSMGFGLLASSAQAGETLQASLQGQMQKQVQERGRETGLLLPRFVSLKSAKVNLRVGPGRKYAITWRYEKRGLPVEIIQEFDLWRRVRDSEGATGWVLHSLLSSKRTAIVTPLVKPGSGLQRAVLVSGKRSAHSTAATVARLQSGVLVNVGTCEGKWCAVETQNVGFYLEKKMLWGVYPGETVDG